MTVHVQEEKVWEDVFKNFVAIKLFTALTPQKGTGQA